MELHINSRKGTQIKPLGKVPATLIPLLWFQARLHPCPQFGEGLGGLKFESIGLTCNYGSLQSPHPLLCTHHHPHLNFGNQH